MIYLYTYESNANYTHHFYNPDDSSFYTTSVFSTGVLIYNKIMIDKKNNTIFKYGSCSSFKYKLPSKLNIIIFVDNKHKLTQLYDSVFKIALNSI